MKKLFNLHDCSLSEPTDPGPGSTSQEMSDYDKAWWDYVNACIAELGKIPKGTPPRIPVDTFQLEDAFGYIWTKTVSSAGVKFSLDFFESLAKSKPLSIGKPDSVLIIAIWVSLNDDYSVLTLGAGGIQLKKLKRSKVRFVNLSKAITNHAELPNEDLNKIPNDFWIKQQVTPFLSA